MEGKFIVRKARFHRLDPNVYVLQGYTWENTLEGTTLRAVAGKMELPLAITQREGLQVRQQYFSIAGSNGQIDREFFLWITLPGPGAGHYTLRVIQEKDGREVTVFRTGSAQLERERFIPENYLETYQRNADRISIGGWAVGKGPCRIFVQTLKGEKIPVSVSRHYRREIVEEYPELRKTDSAGESPADPEYGYEVSFDDPGCRFLKLIVSGGKRAVGYRIDLKRGAKGVQGLGTTLASKTLTYLRRNGLMRTVKKAAAKTGEKLKSRKTDYMSWRKDFLPTADVLEEQRRRTFADPPLISIVVPLYKTPPKYLKELVMSVRAQTYPHWELCLSDGSGKDSPLEKILRDLSREDDRIRVVSSDTPLGISENTNAAIGIARGSWIAFADHDDLLTPDALYETASCIESRPRAELIYSDEDKVSMDGKTFFEPHFKSDYNPDLLCSVNYICHLCVISAALLEKTGLLDPAFDGAQDHDLVLRACEKAGEIVHIPRVLYHWRSHTDSTAANPASKKYAFEAGVRAVQAHYDRLGIKADVVMGEYPGLYVTLYRMPADPPLISVIIPNKDHGEDLEKCITSLEEKSAYRNFEIIVVENNSELAQTFELYRKIGERYDNVRVITWENEFNYPLINNFGAKEAKGDYLLFLNNDTQLISPDSLTALLGPCLRPEVGCSGALLLYPDETIQHAGVIIGYGGIAGHAFQGMSSAQPGYFSRIICQSDLSAVTAACLMMRREIFEEEGGFDPVFKVAFNDIDLCLRLRRRGLLVVYNPQARFYHFESKSRGYEDSAGKIERFNSEADEFIRRWPDILRDGDPFYNPNLTLDANDFSLRKMSRML